MVRFAIIIMVLALMALSCGIRRIPPSDTDDHEPTNEPLFDPLETPRDREIVPEVYPVRVAVVPDGSDTLAQPGDLSYVQFDSAVSTTGPTEVYRVQIFTSRLYTEAARERKLAEEIFNLPIYLDYEVPYYKLRVGNFASRPEAEDMLAEIKVIGYRNAWVARVVLRVMDAPEYETDDEPILPEETQDSLSLPSDTLNQEAEDDY